MPYARRRAAFGRPSSFAFARFARRGRPGSTVLPGRRARVTGRRRDESARPGITTTWRRADFGRHLLLRVHPVPAAGAYQATRRRRGPNQHGPASEPRGGGPPTGGPPPSCSRGARRSRGTVLPGRRGPQRVASRPCRGQLSGGPGSGFGTGSGPGGMGDGSGVGVGFGGSGGGPGVGTGPGPGPGVGPGGTGSGYGLVIRSSSQSVDVGSGLLPAYPRGSPPVTQPRDERGPGGGAGRAGRGAGRRGPRTGRGLGGAVCGAGLNAASHEHAITPRCRRIGGGRLGVAARTGLNAAPHGLRMTPWCAAAAGTWRPAERTRQGAVAGRLPFARWRSQGPAWVCAVGVRSPRGGPPATASPRGGVPGRRRGPRPGGVRPT